MSKIEKPSTDKALAIFADLTPDKVYTPGGVDTILAKITDEVRKTVIDVSTRAGRDAANSLAYKVARSKTLLDDMGKELVADWKSKAALVDAERKTIRDRLGALKDEVKKPVDEWEQAEADRVAAHLNAIVAIEELARFDVEPGSAEITGRLDLLRRRDVRDYQEFAEQADAACKVTIDRLAEMQAAAVKREADAAELETLRAEKAERDARDQAEAEAKARAERIAKDAEEVAERARVRAEQIEREKEAAAASAIEQERRRVAAAQAAEEAAERKRQANAKHRAKIHREITLALSEVLTGNADEAAALIEAIAAGRIPHVSITY
jgi:colicin import membrane protein